MREPDVVRLLVLALMRAEKVDATSKGRVIDSVTGVEARDTFTNNNLFRQASFRPRRGIEFTELAQAEEAFEETFGRQFSEFSPGPMAAELRQEVVGHEDAVTSARDVLTRHRLPGTAMLEDARSHMRTIMSPSSDENAIGTFNASHRAIKDAIKRAAKLDQVLTDPRLHDLDRASEILDRAWPALKDEIGVGQELESRAAELTDLLARETFYRDLPAIEQHAHAIEVEYTRRFDAAQQARIDAYTKALDQLASEPGWHEVSEDTQREIAAPLVAGQQPRPHSAPISLLRSDRDACEARLHTAIRRLREIVEGERLAEVEVRSYFAGGIETEEQLDAALSGLREECARLIGAGKKVVVS